jgi:HD-like signal output (HDOD) protein
LSAIVPARISTLCWRHNLATAIIGKWLGASTELSPDRCYIAGLVHDIGALAMLRVFPSYESALLEGAQQGAELLAAETALFGIDHAEAGRWLLSNWGCPIDLQNVAAYHEEPWSGPEPDRPLLSLVHAASRLADHLELSIFGSQREADMQEIADFLPEKAAALLLSRFPDLVEYVAIRVNEVELSLM